LPAQFHPVARPDLPTTLGAYRAVDRHRTSLDSFLGRPSGIRRSGKLQQGVQLNPFRFDLDPCLLHSLLPPLNIPLSRSAPIPPLSTAPAVPYRGTAPAVPLWAGSGRG